MPITSGSITILRRVNTGDYSHKEVKVEIAYYAEGNEKIGDLGDHARVEALTQVMMALSTVVKLEQTPELVIDGTVCRLTDPAEQSEPPLYGTSPAAEAVAALKVENEKRRRRTKAEMEAARAGNPIDHTSAPGTVSTAEAPTNAPTPSVPDTDTRGSVSADPTGAPGAEAQSSASVNGEDERWATGPLKEITDKELTEACNIAMGRVYDANKIRAVISKFTDGSVATIAQDKRSQFIFDIGKL